MSRVRPMFRSLPLALAAALAAGCTFQPPALPAAIDPTPAPAAPRVEPAAERAIAACLGRAEAQGLQVTGVDRADPLLGAGGVVLGQNVFLDVGRGGQSFTVRCAYTEASREARIMTL